MVNTSVSGHGQHQCVLQQVLWNNLLELQLISQQKMHLIWNILQYNCNHNKRLVVIYYWINIQTKSQKVQQLFFHYTVFYEQVPYT